MLGRTGEPRHPQLSPLGGSASRYTPKATSSLVPRSWLLRSLPTCRGRAPRRTAGSGHCPGLGRAGRDDQEAKT